jgi:hypothetical protein
MNSDQEIEQAGLKSADELPIKAGDRQRRGGPRTGPRESIQEERYMNSLIQQAQASALTGTAATQRTAGAARTGAAGAAASNGAITETEEAASVSIDATPSSPPPEVLAQVQQAAASWQELQAKGYEVHYSQDSASSRTTAELRDAQGVVVRRLTPSEAVALAAGESLGQE